MSFEHPSQPQLFYDSVVGFGFHQLSTHMDLLLPAQGVILQPGSLCSV